MSEIPRPLLFLCRLMVVLCCIGVVIGLLFAFMILAVIQPWLASTIFIGLLGALITSEWMKEDR